MKVKTSELSRKILDYAVAKAYGFDEKTLSPLIWMCVSYPSGCFNYSNNWDISRSIIVNENIVIIPNGIENDGKQYRASKRTITESSIIGVFPSFGSTELEAALRCYIFSRLGEEVEIHENLVQKYQ